MDDWQEELLDEHLHHWFSPAEVDALYQTDRSAEEVAAELSTYDFAFFCRYYLHDYFSEAPAEIHWDVFGDIQWAVTNNQSTALAECLPRGYGKSTIISVGMPLWCVVGGSPPHVRGAKRVPYKRYIFVMKDSFDQAKLELAAIRNEIESNEDLRRDFGDLVGAPWGKAEIVTANGTKIDALGTGQKVRGRRHGPYRPDLIIADDLENDDMVQSPTQRMKVKTWWARAVEKAGDPRRCDYIALGTLIHYDCFQAWMLARPGVRARKYRALVSHADRQDMWDEWERLLVNLDDPYREVTAQTYYETHKAEMLAGSSVTWPERFPYVTLRQMMLGESQMVHGKSIHAFSAEMQNEPISDEDRLFKNIGVFHYEDDHGVKYLVPDTAGERVPLRNCRLYGACDPSLGETKGGDFSAVVDLLLAPNGRMFVAHASIERRHPDRIIDHIAARARFWAEIGMYYSWFVIETNQFQKLFAATTGQQLLRSGIRLPITQVTSQQQKTARIDSLQPDLLNNYILLYKELGRAVPDEQNRLWQQLHDYPLGDFVDGPDCLEMARTVAASGGGGLVPSHLSPLGQDQWTIPGTMAVGPDPWA